MGGGGWHGGAGVLGFDVTAVLAGLGIGRLAVGLAAKSVISDVIAAGSSSPNTSSRSAT